MKDVNTFSKHSSFLSGIEALKYIDRIKFSNEHKASEDINSRVNDIRENGFTKIENFVSKDELNKLSRNFQSDLEQGRFEMPTLAQSRIDPTKHQELIDNYLRGSGATYLKQGIGFDKNEFQNLDQIIRDFRPSTLKSYYNPHSPLFFKAILSERVRSILEAYMGLSLIWLRLIQEGIFLLNLR